MFQTAIRTRLTNGPMVALLVAAACHGGVAPRAGAGEATLDRAPFGAEFPGLDGWATGAWWTKRAKQQPFSLEIPREDVIAFALYTVTVHPVAGGASQPADATLKLTAQCFPLKPGEPQDVRLEVRRGDAWEEVGRSVVHYPGWDAHFRVEHWDATRDHAYRVRHGEAAVFEGLVRRDPANKPAISVAVLSCNSSKAPGPREEIVAGLRAADPDLLFFAGDQSYRHEQHTYAWIEFGLQFRDVIRDRPTVTIPDDHDVGHPNLWGAGGKKALRKDGADGGYFFPASYVSMVERQQTWHLPDPVDPAPVDQGIGVYFTRLVLGGVDFAILEDRKFKTGPAGAIPQMGPRPNHIIDPACDRKAIDLPGLELLGTRARRRAVVVHRPRDRQHDLRPLVASVRREARRQSGARQPAPVDRRLRGRSRQQDFRRSLRESRRRARRKTAGRRLWDRPLRLRRPHQGRGGHAHVRMLAAVSPHRHRDGRPTQYPGWPVHVPIMEVR